MTQEEKFLVLKDLCARLPYGVMIQIPELFYPQRKVAEKLVTINDLWRFNDDGIYIENVKPYLRPISSMTEEEDKKRIELGIWINTIKGNKVTAIDKNVDEALEWLNAHHFDYRGLIERGLAFEAPKDMYNIK